MCDYLAAFGAGAGDAAAGLFFAVVVVVHVIIGKQADLEYDWGTVHRINK